MGTYFTKSPISVGGFFIFYYLLFNEMLKTKDNPLIYPLYLLIQCVDIS